MSPLRELAAIFLKLGLISFGGPAAHIALMEAEFVTRRGWLTREEFLDLVGASSIIPGPNSTELAIHIGRRRAGGAGLLVAGLAFLTPAVLFTLALAWAYKHYGQLPQATAVLQGIKAVMLAIVLHAVARLVPTALKTRPLAALAVAVFAASLAGVHELALLLGAGLVWAALPLQKGRATALLLPLAAAPAAAAATAAPPTASSLFLVFLKIGSVLFGSGYVLLAFLQSELVDRRGWLTRPELIDAIAAGQATPGPVFSTATFIGYLLGGTPGAAAATAGLFLPAFVFVALSAPLLPRLRAQKATARFLDGVNAAALALIAAVSIGLGRAAIVDGPTALLFAAALVALCRNVNPTWLILAGAALGLVLHHVAVQAAGHAAHGGAEVEVARHDGHEVAVELVGEARVLDPHVVLAVAQLPLHVGAGHLDLHRRAVRVLGGGGDEAAAAHGQDAIDVARRLPVVAGETEEGDAHFVEGGRRAGGG